jgi:1,4-dihydroxy-2-naphthoyl-CoA hydrolase
MSDRAQEMQQAWQGTLADTLGIEILEAEPDRVRARIVVQPLLCTVGGVLHGGSMMAFADTLGAVATLLNLPSDARTTTIESKTNFLSGAPLGTPVIGECTPVHRGRTTMVWQTRLMLESGKLIALVTQTQLVLRA